MLGTYFYHEILRKTVISFGTLFNDINVRHDDRSGATISETKVPLIYGPKQKFLAKLEQQEELTKATAITLPRMSFEMSSMNYDPSRKGSITRTFKAVDKTDSTKTKKVYLPVPYNVGFELNVMTKLNDDALQIVEQILPFFQPDYTITLNDNTSMGTTRDVPIILSNVTYADEYDGSFEDRRVLTYTLSFTSKFYLYGPVTDQKVIKRVQVDQYTDVQVNAPKREQRYSVTPNPVGSSAPSSDDDNFGFNEEVSFFEDAKNYDESSGTDTDDA